MNLARVNARRFKDSRQHLWMRTERDRERQTERERERERGRERERERGRERERDLADLDPVSANYGLMVNCRIIHNHY